MSITAIQTQPPPVEVFYPESDGKPMAENTQQYDYLTTLKAGIAARFKDDPNVFVAGDLLWYPVQGRPDINVAPDVLIAFGRPQGKRGSYKQWEEGNVAPQVVFEILSPSNTKREMQAKRTFYNRHGVEEYYEYDPDNGTLECWQRAGEFFSYIPIESEWTSPRLGITLRLEADGALSAFHPDGRKFELPEDAIIRANEAESRAERLAAKLRELGVDPE